MAVKLNHLIVPVKDRVASAQLFAEIFGLEVKPSQSRFAQVPIDEYLTIDFADDEHTREILHFVPEQLESHHYAFHVTDEEFDGILARVKAKGLTYGSGPTTDTEPDWRPPWWQSLVFQGTQRPSAGSDDRAIM